MFNEIIYRPILNLTIFIYNTLGANDFGLAIVTLTVFVRAILLPLSLRATRTQKKISQLSPEIDKIKKDFPDQASQGAAMMELYKKHKVNPIGGCLPLLLQLPILLGVYQVLLNIFKPNSLAGLYSFVAKPEIIQPLMFGLLNMQSKSGFVSIIAGATQFIQAKMSLAQAPSSPSQAMNKNLMIAMPVLVAFIGWNLPMGVSLYWITTTLFSIGEQLYLRRS
ncbi:MAG: Membrane protein insertase, YidC/Oxa1 family [Parcubacteria group bacterium GW2011_GWC1_45_9]|nr:MAG: Membrane protein insertase, YidC/Oxa1 family [Parcubacteria group bacterium GW2011_GWC1_45_9]